MTTAYERLACYENPVRHSEVVEKQHMTNTLFILTREYDELVSVHVAGMEKNDTISLFCGDVLVEKIYYNVLESHQKTKIVEIPFFFNDKKIIYGSSKKYAIHGLPLFELGCFCAQLVLMVNSESNKEVTLYLKCNILGDEFRKTLLRVRESVVLFPFIQIIKQSKQDMINVSSRSKLQKIVLVGEDIDKVSVKHKNFDLYKSNREIKTFIEKDPDTEKDRFVINFDYPLSPNIQWIDIFYTAKGPVEIYTFENNQIIITNGSLCVRYT